MSVATSGDIVLSVQAAPEAQAAWERLGATIEDLSDAFMDRLCCNTLGEPETPAALDAIAAKVRALIPEIERISALEEPRYILSGEAER